LDPIACDVATNRGGTGKSQLQRCNPELDSEKVLLSFNYGMAQPHGLSGKRALSAKVEATPIACLDPEARRSPSTQCFSTLRRPLFNTFFVGQNFVIKQALNMCLKIMKFFKHFRLMFEKKNPHKLTKTINETYIVIVLLNRTRSKTSDIREN
jgi:hypothetical protein